MRLVRARKDGFVFLISPYEKEILFHLLSLYPLVPAAHHSLTRGGEIPNEKENQQLLEELTKTGQEENRRLLAALIADPRRLKSCEEGFFLILSRGEVEWFLQMVNDIRVGSWLLLESPEEVQAIDFLRKNHTKPPFVHMNLAGQIEMILLMALNSRARKRGKKSG